MGLMDKLGSIGKRLLGTTNEQELKRYTPLVDAVEAREAEMQGKDDADLRELGIELRRKVREDGVSLESVQVEAFALVREVADRQLGIWQGIAGRGPHGDVTPTLSDEDLGDQLQLVTQARERLAAGEAQHEILLPASVYRQVRSKHPHSVPPFRMRAHRCQLVGAAILHDGKIAELKTGEGKTLVAAFPCYLNALSGKGVHVVTVNDYLAGRDAAWNAPIFAFLDMQVGALKAEMDSPERKPVYAMDVTYGTNNQFGFDYLRDNLKRSINDQVQTRRDFAIVDEVDSVLIDECRTPLIISGPAQGRDEFYLKADEVARQLKEGEHFEVDIKDRNVTLTEEGIDKATELFGVNSMFDAEGMHLPHFLDNALKAHHLFKKDHQYLVQGGEIRIVDEFTGRVLAGRRWSEGQHQAIEAKEGVAIQPETMTYATITLQNFFRLYGKLAGMTGTAVTEANEFHSIYKLHPLAVPTNKPVVRADMPDLIFGSEPEKFEAIVKEVEELNAAGEPVLVGTVAVETSEKLSEALKRKGIKHNVLNARQNEREAEIITDAGQVGAVTIATNMAGRGTDIKLGKCSLDNLLKHWKKHGMAPKRIQRHDANLDEACIDLWAKKYLGEEEAGKLRGGDPATILAQINKQRKEMGWFPLPLPSSLADGADVRQLGGLRIIGTERHESRRIDNQLRGRSGRQGDPGSSRFYLSLDDQLMKRFAGPTMSNLMRSMGLKDGVPIESKMVSRAVEKAQKRVEEFNFGIRKNVLEYDEVMNLQRKQIYTQRQGILKGENLEEVFWTFYSDALDELVQKEAEDGTRGDALAEKLSKSFAEITGLTAPAASDVPVLDGGDACRDFLLSLAKEAFEARKQEHGEEIHATLLRYVLLDIMDRRWTDHIDFMDQLRRGIGLESYGQKDPKMRFKEEGFRRFTNMFELIRHDLLQMFFRLEVVRRPEQPEPGVDGMLQAGGFAPSRPKTSQMRTGRAAPPAPQQVAPVAPVGTGNQPAPEDPCPCGSGQQFKHCHGVV